MKPDAHTSYLQNLEILQPRFRSASLPLLQDEVHVPLFIAEIRLLLVHLSRGDYLDASFNI